MTSYLTLARDAEVEIEVKRSRFRCTLRRVGTEAAARAVVDRLRRDHWDARHHCSAFRLGPPPGPVERSSDDGEPAGTAGAPMLDVLRGAAVADVVAVVTRWFGGTLLGAGGLVRAYGDAVRLGLEEAGTLRRALVGEYAVAVSHAEAGRLETALRGLDAPVLDATYGAGVRLVVGVTPERVEEIAAALAALSSGNAHLERIGERWVDQRPERH